MRDPNSSQNGQDRPEDRFRKYGKWQDIPLDVLREFAAMLRLEYTDRGLAQRVGMSTAAVQDFATGRKRPERRTLQAFGELYMERIPLSFEWETVTERKTLPQLKSVLPAGEDAALDYVYELIRAAEASGTLPESPDRLREWLEFLVRAEYAIDTPYDHLIRKRRPRGSGETAAPRKGKPTPDSEK
ncbi:MAG TPA: hypothetical protein VFJ16_08135 [Longimicrobium sp.]|nr:hypothetical protein [Longimicrobium sp.]